MFKDEINELELLRFESDYIIKKGNLPILFTAPHTMKQIRENGTIKLRERQDSNTAISFKHLFIVTSL